MFKGPSHTSLDDKGRLTLPTRFRELFAPASNRFTITRHPHGSLLIFTPDAWEKFSEKIAVMPMESQGYKRIFYGYAMDLELDKAGRFTVPPELRSAVGMPAGCDLQLMGMGSYLEVWERSQYAAFEVRLMQAAPPAAIAQLEF